MIVSHTAKVVRNFALAIVLAASFAVTRSQMAQAGALPSGTPRTDSLGEYRSVPSEAESLVADKEYQEAIANVVETDRYPADPMASEKLRQDRLEQCKQLFQKDRTKFIRQTIVYSAAPVGVGYPRSRELAIFAILKAMDAQSDRQSLILSILPLLETRNESIRRNVDVIQGWIESNTDDRSSFASYRSFLGIYESRRLPPPRALIVYMLKAAPGRALLTLDAAFPSTTAEPRRQIRWTEHVVSDYLWKKENDRLNGETEKNLASRELANLLRLPQWWTHVYVAEILNKDAELRTPELIEGLKNDEDVRVKELRGKW